MERLSHLVQRTGEDVQRVTVRHQLLRQPVVELLALAEVRRTVLRQVLWISQADTVSGSRLQSQSYWNARANILALHTQPRCPHIFWIYLDCRMPLPPLKPPSPAPSPHLV